MVAVVFTGVVWLIDALFLKPRRSDDQTEPVVVEYSKSFFPVLAVVFVLRSFLLEPFKIPSESMVPTLEVGDFIVVNKFAYGIRLPVFRTKVIPISDPQRGDVVVFFPPHEDRYFIKRMVAGPGDTVSFRDNTLYLNGSPVGEELIGVDYTPRREIRCLNGEYQLFNEMIGGIEHLMRRCSTSQGLGHDQTWEVPEGHYFMVGDNRDNSADSRSSQWVQGAFVPDKNIVGKAFGIWMHWDEGLPSFSRAGAIN